MGAYERDKQGGEGNQDGDWCDNVCVSIDKPLPFFLPFIHSPFDIYSPAQLATVLLYCAQHPQRTTRPTANRLGEMGDALICGQMVGWLVGFALLCLGC